MRVLLAALVELDHVRFVPVDAEALDPDLIGQARWVPRGYRDCRDSDSEVDLRGPSFDDVD